METADEYIGMSLPKFGTPDVMSITRARGLPTASRYIDPLDEGDAPPQKSNSGSKKVIHPGVTNGGDVLPPGGLLPGGCFGPRFHHPKKQITKASRFALMGILGFF